MDRRLYYLDPVYEKVVMVQLPNGDNPKTLLDNEVDLRTLAMYRKRPKPSKNPCLTNQAYCQYFAIEKCPILFFSFPNFDPFFLLLQNIDIDYREAATTSASRQRTTRASAGARWATRSEKYTQI